MSGGEKLQSISIQRGQKVMSLMNGLEPTKEMVSFLKGLSPMIMQNGLGQTIAFMQSKRDKHGQLLAVLEKVMSAPNGLMDKILNAEINEYLIMQKEAIEYAGWMKKFALASYKEKSNEPAAS
ncbi:type III-B CRISPR module-associated protein Cmr5 [bacterium]|nr:type III-B CRISPR module-associated protein Cmr5 [bacterium]